MSIKTSFFVYVALTAAWLALASSLEQRHDSVQDRLRSAVSGLWGQAQTTQCPFLPDGPAMDSATLQVDLTMEYRKKGHSWYSVYTALVAGEYALPPEAAGKTLKLSLPAGAGMLNQFALQLDGREVTDYSQSGDAVEIPIPENGAQKLTVKHESQGSESWWFNFSQAPRIPKNLDLTLVTNFDEVDFPDGSVSPTLSKKQEQGWCFQWSYDRLLSGGSVGVELPRKRDDGRTLIDICRYGPLGLLLFFGALTLSALDGKKEIHPIHLTLLGCAYFSFHILFVYLADVIPLVVALAVSTAVTTFIIAAYTRRVYGTPFSTQRVIPALALYLLLYSSAFMIEGFKGLPLVALLVLTLHLAMQLSTRLEMSQNQTARN